MSTLITLTSRALPENGNAIGITAKVLDVFLNPLKS